MVRYTITPWRTQADLLAVRQQLYRLNADGEDRRQSAVDRIMAWKLRGNLPHAVESTALLIDAILHHAHGTTNAPDANGSVELNGPANSIFSVRAVYSAAFCRFVTGFCDMGRHRERGLEPTSMQDMARQIDMPPHFVALRHEATHDELPGVARLVAATRLALDWLWRVYWSRLEEPHASATETEDDALALPRVRVEGARVMREFRRAKREALRGVKQRSKASMDLSVAIDLCVELCRGSKTKAQALASVMIEERLIFPSTRELRSSMDGAYLIWDDFIDNICNFVPSYRQALLQSCLDAMASHSSVLGMSDTDHEALALWACHIVDADASLAILAIKWCCLHPSQGAQHLGRGVLEAHGTTVDEWRDLFDASVGSYITKSGAGSVEGKVTVEVDQPVVESDEQSEADWGWRRSIMPRNAPIGVRA